MRSLGNHQLCQTVRCPSVENDCISAFSKAAPDSESSDPRGTSRAQHTGVGVRSSPRQARRGAHDAAPLRTHEWAVKDSHLSEVGCCRDTALPSSLCKMGIASSKKRSQYPPSSRRCPAFLRLRPGGHLGNICTVKMKSFLAPPKSK